VLRVVDQFAYYRGKLFWSEVEDVKQEIIELDDLDTERRKCRIGKVSHVVRHDRVWPAASAHATTCRSSWSGRTIEPSRLTQPETDASSNALFMETKR